MLSAYILNKAMDCLLRALSYRLCILLISLYNIDKYLSTISYISWISTALADFNESSLDFTHSRLRFISKSRPPFNRFISKKVSKVVNLPFWISHFAFRIEEPNLTVLSNRLLRSSWKSNSIFTVRTLILASLVCALRISHSFFILHSFLQYVRGQLRENYTDEHKRTADEHCACGHGFFNNALEHDGEEALGWEKKSGDCWRGEFLTDDLAGICNSCWHNSAIDDRTKHREEAL